MKCVNMLYSFSSIIKSTVTVQNSALLVFVPVGSWNYNFLLVGLYIL